MGRNVADRTKIYDSVGNDIINPAIDRPKVIQWDTDTDFDAGSYSDTVAQGVGAPSKIQLEQNSANDDDVSYNDVANYTPSDDTKITVDQSGNNKATLKLVGGTSREDELILKQDTVYCRGFVSGANNNIIQFKASWYEHESRN